MRPAYSSLLTVIKASQSQCSGLRTLCEEAEEEEEFSVHSWSSSERWEGLGSGSEEGSLSRTRSTVPDDNKLGDSRTDYSSGIGTRPSYSQSESSNSSYTISEPPQPEPPQLKKNQIEYVPGNVKALRRVRKPAALFRREFRNQNDAYGGNPAIYWVKGCVTKLDVREVRASPLPEIYQKKNPRSRIRVTKPLSPRRPFVRYDVCRFRNLLAPAAPKKPCPVGRQLRVQVKKNSPEFPWVGNGCPASGIAGIYRTLRDVDVEFGKYRNSTESLPSIAK